MTASFLRRINAFARPAILNGDVRALPGTQNALDMFKGEWVSKLPPPFSHLKAGTLPLFEDARINWVIDKLGSVEGCHVLELGPLEGGHTYMMEKFGAASITAIEANSRAYLRCLVVKETLGLKRACFLCGDFMEYLRANASANPSANQQRFDLCLASGVLNHLRKPAELLRLLAQTTDRLFIWTHYYDAQVISRNPRLASRFRGQVRAAEVDFTHTLHRQVYRTTLNLPGSRNGGDLLSSWMTRADILGCLAHFGFNDIQVGFEQPNHVYGPAFAVIARRR
jgi:hypothetical protein